MSERDCIHGQLARSCGLCERDATIAALRAACHEKQEAIDSLKAHQAEMRTINDRVHLDTIAALQIGLERVQRLHIEAMDECSMKAAEIKKLRAEVARYKALHTAVQSWVRHDYEYLPILDREKLRRVVVGASRDLDLLLEPPSGETSAP